MLRSSDLLNLRVSDVISKLGTIKTVVKVKQKKTGKATLSILLIKNSIDSIKRHLVDKEQDDYIFKGNKSHYNFPPITHRQYSRMVKDWMSSLEVEDVSEYSTHKFKKDQTFCDSSRNTKC